MVWLKTREGERILMVELTLPDALSPVSHTVAPFWLTSPARSS